MRRVLLTGGAGFVGANLARRLLREGHEVHVTVRPGADPWRLEEIRDDVDVSPVDLGDAETLGAIVDRVRPEWVFHLAAHGGFSSQTDLQQMLRANVIGTVNLVEVARRTGFEAFVNTGSSSEYGFKDTPPAEDEWLDPNSHYAVTKAAATLFCRFTARRYGLPLPTLRLYSVYGPWEEPSRLLPTLIARGFRGELPPLVSPDVARDYVYIEDVVDAYLLAATHSHSDPGVVYNVGTGVQTSLDEVVGIAREVLGITAEPAWGSMPNRAWDTTAWRADNRRLRERLGWQPRYGVVSGFRTMVSWFRNHPELTTRYRLPASGILR